MDEQDLFAQYEEKNEADYNAVGLRRCPICKDRTGEYFVCWDSTLHLIEKHFPAVSEASALWEKPEEPGEDDYDEEPFPETIIYLCTLCAAKIQKDLRPKPGSLMLVSD